MGMRQYIEQTSDGVMVVRQGVTVRELLAGVTLVGYDLSPSFFIIGDSV